MKGRAAIVTGAASGIGRAIATDLAAQGVRVLFADVNVEEGERVAADFSTGVFQRADTAKQGAATRSSRARSAISVASTSS